MGNNQTFTSRRGVDSESASWTRNRNLARRSRKGLGKISYSLVVGMLTLIVGLIYVAQGTKATSYDYEISEIEEQISEVEIRKEDLAVEQAKLTSLATAGQNKVAMNMEDAVADGYAE